MNISLLIPCSYKARLQLLYKIYEVIIAAYNNRQIEFDIPAHLTKFNVCTLQN